VSIEPATEGEIEAGKVDEKRIVTREAVEPRKGCGDTACAQSISDPRLFLDAEELVEFDADDER
jgi:hypothetical protein